jgi:glutamine phosphoribosylpyrophosphate amidotransferase
MTIDIDPATLAQLRQRAAASGRTLSAVVQELLQYGSRRMHDAATSPRVRIPRSTRRGGLRSGVDLDNTADLLNVMDRSDTASRRLPRGPRPRAQL